MEFSEQIIQVIDKIAEKIGIAIDWSQENILSYMQDLLRRYTTMQIASNTVAAIYLFITGLLSGIIIVHILKQYSKGNENSIFIKSNSCSYDFFEDGQLNALGTTAFVTGIVLIGISIPYFITCINSIIRWIAVPEIQLLSDLKGILSEY